MPSFPLSLPPACGRSNGSSGRTHSSSFCFLMSSECVFFLLRRKESRKAVEGDTSSLQHLQVSAGHWELHIFPLRSAGREEKRSDEGKKREIKDTTIMVTFFELSRLEVLSGVLDLHIHLF